MEPRSVKSLRTGLEGAASLTAVAPPDGIKKVRNFTAQLEGANSLTAVAPSIFDRPLPQQTELSTVR